MWVFVCILLLSYKSFAILNLGISIEINSLWKKKLLFIFTMTKQLQMLGQVILMAILKISVCSKNMDILPLSSLISPVTLDSEGEGGMIWENGILTCILSCKKWIASLCLMQDIACLGLVHGDDPETCYGEGSSCLGTHVRIKDFKIKKIKNWKKNKCFKKNKIKK